MKASVARIDPLSWGIRIDEPAPKVDEPLDAWKQPGRFPVMRKVLHESVHFWHSVSTDFGIRLAFDSLKSMNSLRLAAARGEDLTKIGPDWTFDGYRPFTLLDEYRPFTILPDGSQLRSSVSTGLSAIQIFEGLARFWDHFIPTGLPFEELDREMSSENELYGEAYRLANRKLGAFAPHFFPIIGYLSLCNEANNPASLFVESLNSCSRLIQDNELDADAHPIEAWHQVWQLSAQGKVMIRRPNAPLTTYQQWMKRLTSWKSRYTADLLKMGDSWIGGHPILEPYANAVFSVLSDSHPNMDRRQVEEQVPFFCAVPGILSNYQTLVLRMPPPLITFSNGIRWITPPPRRQDSKTFGEGLRLFSDMMGAALGLISKARGATWDNACSCTTCPVHEKNLCVSVLEYPPTHGSCNFKSLVLEKEFHV